MPAAGGQGPWGSSPAAPRGSAPSGDSTGCNGLDLVFTLEQTHVDEERVRKIGVEGGGAEGRLHQNICCILYGCPHLGFLLEHRGHLQEGRDHLLRVRGRQVLYQVVLLSATREAREIQLM